MLDLLAIKLINPALLNCNMEQNVTVYKTPPDTGNLSSPAVGRIKKLRKRRITTPKRSYTPELKQNLITSVFIYFGQMTKYSDAIGKRSTVMS